MILYQAESETDLDVHFAQAKADGLHKYSKIQFRILTLPERAQLFLADLLNDKP